ncbi:hypothetical protein TNCV_2807871 [Trichonephila clavipes]|nr:hypothetical protein TNCV_2807871 [Trichonephila clavipes]
MDVCNCIVPAGHGSTLNSRRAASPFVRLVEGEERWEASDHPPECSPSKLGWNRAKLYCHLFRSIPTSLWPPPAKSIAPCACSEPCDNEPKKENKEILQTPDLQAHNLILKIGAPIMLIRNIDAPRLCNGTRLIVKKLMQHVIQATVLTGCAKEIHFRRSRNMKTKSLERRKVKCDDPEKALKPEVILSMGELNLDQAAQDINREEFQLELVRLQAFVAATDPGCKKELIRLRFALAAVFSELPRIPVNYADSAGSSQHLAQALVIHLFGVIEALPSHYNSCLVPNHQKGRISFIE